MISKKVENIRGRITEACARVGRDPAGVTLVAVTKTFSVDAIRAAVTAGTRDVGENYVQELLAKREALQDDSVRWHFVGHLQSNKVRQIVPWISMIHAVDSGGLVREIDRRAKSTGRVIDCLIEVNTTGEKSKFGIDPRWTHEFVRELEDLNNVRLAGLMTIGPFLPDPEGSRPMFRLLRELRDKLATLRQGNAPMQHLSMGMSGDFEVGIEEGATLIRIGTAIFGRRIKNT